MVKIRRTIVDCFREKWVKYGALRKLFFLLFILFLLFWASIASIFALPAITSVYFMTMIIKNILDIHANWKWGSLFPNKKDKTGEIVGEVAFSDDTFVKFPFPSEDPRTPPQPIRPSKRDIRSAKVNPEVPEKKKGFGGWKKDDKEIRIIPAQRAKEDDKKEVKSAVGVTPSAKPEIRGEKVPHAAPAQGGQKVGIAGGTPVKKPEIHIAPAGKMVDTTTQGNQPQLKGVTGAIKDDKTTIRSAAVHQMAGGDKVKLAGTGNSNEPVKKPEIQIAKVERMTDTITQGGQQQLKGVVGANKDDKFEIRGSTVFPVAGDDKVESVGAGNINESVKKPEIRSIHQQKMADTSKDDNKGLKGVTGGDKKDDKPFDIYSFQQEKLVDDKKGVTGGLENKKDDKTFKIHSATVKPLADTSQEGKKDSES